MKRLSVLTALLVFLSCGAAFAQRAGYRYLGGIGVTYLTVNERYTSGTSTKDVTLSGLGGQSTFMTGVPLGLFGSVSLAYALSGSSGGSPLVMTIYTTRLMFNMLFGIGYRMQLSPALSLFFGGGGSAVGALMLAASYTDSLNLAYAGGFGAMVKADYAFTRQVSVYLNANGAYDPFAVVHASNVGFKTGFEYAFGAGLAFLY